MARHQINIAADGAYGAGSYRGPTHPNGYGVCHILKTAGSATVTLQCSEDGTNWVGVLDINGNAIAPTTTTNKVVAFRTRAQHFRILVASQSGLAGKVWLR